MAVQIPAFATDQQYPFYFLRKMMSAFATAGVVTPSTDFIVSPSSGLQVQVTAGAAFVQQTVNIEGSSAYNGLYYVINDATSNPFNTILAPTVNPRIDQVILKIYDVQEQGLGGTTKGQIEWLQGTENASASLSTMGPGLSNPGATALPANSLRLAYVLQTVGEVVIAGGNVLNTPTYAVSGLPRVWQPLTLGTGVIAYPGAYTPSARLEGDIVRFKGTLQNNSGGVIASGTVLTVPSGMANTESSINIDLPIIVPGTSGMFLTAAAGSAAFALTENGGTGWPSLGALKLDGLTYTIS